MSEHQAKHQAERIGPFLRRRGDLVAYWCPGCDCAHMLNVETADRKDGLSAWDFDGNADAPTFTPSVHASYPGRAAYTDDAGTVHEARERKSLCHVWIKAGVIEYLGDSHGHTLRGLHPMVPFPDNYGGWS